MATNNGGGRDPAVRVRYRECLRNHGLPMNLYLLDGCGEFTPSGANVTPEPIACAACGCFRNFHRREEVQQHRPRRWTTTVRTVDPPLTLPAPPPPLPLSLLPPQSSPPPPPPAAIRNVSLGDDNPPPSEALSGAVNSGDRENETKRKKKNPKTKFTPTPPPPPQPPAAISKSSRGGDKPPPSEAGSGAVNGGDREEETKKKKKRPKTVFTEAQRARMREFAEKLGWRMTKHDEESIESFCKEIGINPQAYRVWIHNHRYRRMEPGESSATVQKN
ncbi:hypothetical protein U1Q18_035473 [Sarracenia purpurea var. burkii]